MQVAALGVQAGKADPLAKEKSDVNYADGQQIMSLYARAMTTREIVAISSLMYWRMVMSRFIIEFGDRLSDHL